MNEMAELARRVDLRIEKDEIARRAKLIDGLPASLKPIRFIPPKRAVAFDTETTGLYPLKGDKLVSIGVVITEGADIVDKREWFCNPGRPIDLDASRVHEIYDRDVIDKPSFAEIAQDFLQTIGDDTLVIQNSDFDMGFINIELQAAGYSPIKNPIIDMLEYARLSQKAGAPGNLDHLMKQIGVSHINRDHHGAMKDAEALAYVYLAFRAEAEKLPPEFSRLPQGRAVRPVRQHLFQPAEVASFEMPNP